MTIRHPTIIALLLALALVLCACAGADGNSPPASDTSGGDTGSDSSAVEVSKEDAGSKDSGKTKENGSKNDKESSSSVEESGESSQPGEESSKAVSADPIEVTFAEGSDGSVSVTFSRLPVSVAELEASDAEYFQHPQYAAAMFLAVMCSYGDDPAAALDMVDYLKGPETLSDYDRSFLKDRMIDKLYLPYSYFDGASVENDYTPDEPYTVRLSENSYSRDEKGFIKFFISSAGADSPRPVTVRQKGSTGEWFLWEQSLLVGIRLPASMDKWS